MKEEGMTEGDGGGVARRIEEMAGAVYGLPRDRRSRAGADEVAAMIARLSAVRFEEGEEPLMPPLPRPEARPRPEGEG